MLRSSRKSRNGVGSSLEYRIASFTRGEKGGCFPSYFVTFSARLMGSILRPWVTRHGCPCTEVLAGCPASGKEEFGARRRREGGARLETPLTFLADDPGVVLIGEGFGVS